MRLMMPDGKRKHIIAENRRVLDAVVAILHSHQGDCDGNGCDYVEKKLASLRLKGDEK